MIPLRSGFRSTALDLMPLEKDKGCVDLSQQHTWRFYMPIAAISENRQVCSVQRLRFSPIADVWHVRYRRLNSPAFAKRARSRDFPRLLLQIASKTNSSGWTILSHEFSKLPHRRDRRKKSQSVSTSIGGENRLRFSLAIKFTAIDV